MASIEIVQIIAASTIPLAAIGLVVLRICTKKGIGVRLVQFMAVTTLIPTILILATERILDGCSVAALIGALTGYLFSQIGEFDRKKRDESIR